MSSNRIRQVMDRAVEDVAPSLNAFDATEMIVRRRSKRRRVASLVVASSISVASGVFLWAAFQGTQGLPDPSSSTGAAATASDGATISPSATDPVTPSYPPPVSGVSALPVPVVEGGDDGQVIPLTFPDGTRLELSVPREADVSDLGVRGSTTGNIRTSSGQECCDRSIEIYYGDPGDTGFLGDRILATFPGVNGSEVVLQEGDPQNGAELYLVYRFGPWTVLVYDTSDGLSDEERGTWALGLGGEVDDNGMLTLIANPPLQLQAPGFPTGPQLHIIGPFDSPEIAIYPQDCAPSGDVPLHPFGEDGVFAEWCPEGGLIQVRASGGSKWVESLIAGLSVREPR